MDGKIFNKEVILMTENIDEEKKKQLKEAEKKIKTKTTLEDFKELAKLEVEKLEAIIKKTANRKTHLAAIITHFNPDPDAVSSALAIKRYLKKQNVNAEILADWDYLSRETKTIINKIGIEIKSLETFNPKKHKAVILIDVASVSQSNLNMEDVVPDLILDHHNNESPFGSTAAITALLMKILDYEIDNDLATALRIGIKTDTKDGTSEKYSRFDAFAYRNILPPLVDERLYKEIVACGRTERFRELRNNANDPEKYFYKQEGSIVISGLGFIKNQERSYIAQIADDILEEDNVDTVISIAVVERDVKSENGSTTSHEELLVLSIRTSAGFENAGKLAKKVFGDKVAGGALDKAGGEMPLDFILTGIIQEIKEVEDEKAKDTIFRYILKRVIKKALEEQEQ